MDYNTKKQNSNILSYKLIFADDNQLKNVDPITRLTYFVNYVDFALEIRSGMFKQDR